MLHLIVQYTPLGHNTTTIDPTCDAVASRLLAAAKIALLSAIVVAVVRCMQQTRASHHQHPFFRFSLTSLHVNCVVKVRENTINYHVCPYYLVAPPPIYIGVPRCTKRRVQVCTVPELVRLLVNTSALEGKHENKPTVHRSWRTSRTSPRRLIYQQSLTRKNKKKEVSGTVARVSLSIDTIIKGSQPLNSRVYCNP